MENKEVLQAKNPLETETIGKLMLKYSLPAIASSLVNSVYNIVDQIFVGNKIGEMGNAATNVAFPLVMIITTLAMTFGAGSSAAFSIYLGQKEEKKGKIRCWKRHDADAYLRYFHRFDFAIVFAANPHCIWRTRADTGICG